MRNGIKRGVALFIMLMTTAACSKGGNLVLEPGARAPRSKGAPAVRVNYGGAASIVQQGQTTATGVHGWVGVEVVTSSKISSASGHSATINMNPSAQ